MEEMLLKEMGQRLSAHRKQLRLTQEEVAELADMATQTLSTSENGIKALAPGKHHQAMWCSENQRGLSIIWNNFQRRSIRSIL